jgi:ABC-type enterochelin transport system permease subunit
MWHIISFVLAMIGALVALAGEPMGAIGFIPMLIASISYDINHSKKE